MEKVKTRKGFTLIEIVVAVSIMLVLIGVLVPSFVHYVSASRADRDDSHMNEVTHGIELALTDQKVFDDVMMYAIENNYSCYADEESIKSDSHKVLDLKFDISDDLKNTIIAEGGVVQEDWWHYDDNARQVSGQALIPSGNMSGVTISFSHRTEPGRTNEMAIEKGLINNMGVGYEKNQKETVLSTLHTDNTTYLYNKIEHIVTDSVDVSSPMYRNSEYTVFIRITPSIMNYDGTYKITHSEIYSQYPDAAIAVYGQWNGTYLEDSRAPVSPEMPAPVVPIVEDNPNPVSPTPQTPQSPQPDDPIDDTSEHDVTPPEARDLVYTGAEQELLYAPDVPNVIYYYKVGNSGWSTDIPQKENAGTYEVLYYVQFENGDISNTGVVNATIKKAASVVEIEGVTVMYSGSEHQLTRIITCTGGDLQFKTVYLDAPASEHEWSGELPKGKESGHYQIDYYVQGDSNHEDSPVGTIDSYIVGTASILTPPTGVSVPYNGGYQVLVNKGVASHGTLMYKLEGGEYSESLPTGINAGEYKIYYYVKGTDGWLDSDEAYVTSRIRKIVPVVKAPIAMNWEYKGTSLVLLSTPGKTTGGTLEYSVDHTNWSTSIPERTDVGTYTVYYRVVGNVNYENVAPHEVIATITLISADSPERPTVEGFTWDWDGTSHTVTTTDKGWTIEYSTDGVSYSTTKPQMSDAGTLTVYWRGRKTNYVMVSGTATLKCNPVNLEYTAPTGLTLKYSDSLQTIVVPGSVVSNYGTVMYKVGDSGAWTSAVPQEKEPGTYIIYYYVQGDTNHIDKGSESTPIGFVESKILQIYNIKFDKNSSDAVGTMDNLTMTYNTSSILPNNKFERTGYQMSGWSLTPDGDVDYRNMNFIRNMTDVNNEEITLYAQWKQYAHASEIAMDIIAHEHTLATKYNDTTHWKYCTTCDYEEEPVGHSKTTSWTGGSARNCSPYNRLETICRENCGYYVSTPTTEPHSGTAVQNLNDYSAYMACSTCGVSYDLHDCVKADGTRIGAKNLGQCSICGYNYTIPKHQSTKAWIGQEYTEGEEIMCFCSDVLAVCNSNTITHKYKMMDNYISHDAVITLPYGVTNIEVFDAGESSSMVRGSDFTYSIDNYVVTLHKDLRYSGHEEFISCSRFGILYKDANGEDTVIYIPAILVPERNAPTFVGAEVKELGGRNGWNKQAVIIQGYENYCNTLSIEIRNKETDELMLSDSVVFDYFVSSGGNIANTKKPWSYTYYPYFESNTPTELAISVTDTFGNASTIYATLDKIDTIAPSFVSSFVDSEDWYQTRDITVIATDNGSRNIEIGLNQLSNLVPADVDGTNYVKTFTIGGDLYEDTQFAVIICDQAGNQALQFAKIGKFDNVRPVIESVEINGTSISISANDYNPEMYSEGSGVAKYGFFNVDSGSDIIWNDTNSINSLPKGEYGVVVMDAVGNMSDPYYITIV